MSEFVDVKNIESKFLDVVFNYMNRTIGVIFIDSISQLEDVWQEAQFELSAKYQYEGVNEHIWDYYLVFCCNFSDGDLDGSLRFKIENDRFCCRKSLFYGVTKKNFSKDGLIGFLFPKVKSTKSIRIITPDSILDRFDEDVRELVPETFFTKELDGVEAERLLNTLISRVSKTDER